MSFFSPKPPVDEDEKDWIETSMLRLGKMFGMEKLQTKPTILPLPEFFPDRFAATEAALDSLVSRVCTYMDVEYENVIVYQFSHNAGRQETLYGHSNNSGAAGYFSNSEQGKFFVGIEENLLTKPVKLVATIAHELAHVLLLGSGKVTREEEDHEYLTDLLTVYLGMGVFTANSVFTFSQWRGAGNHGWSSSRQGYMTEPMLGYALACYCWMRGDLNPPWAKLLSTNPRVALQRGLKYLIKSQHTELPRG